MKNKKYFQIDIFPETKSADLNIYGEITSFPYRESDVSAFNIIKQIDGLNVDEINVYINSPGGDVSEAVAIYSALKRNKARVTTFCDGFACSAASVIFCAGEKRVMGEIAMLMIHKCMSYIGRANSDELRKFADDMEKINQSSIEAYKQVSNLTEEQIKEMMSNETWLTSKEALEYGFATDIFENSNENTVVQSSMQSISKAIIENQNKSDLTTKVDGIMQDIKSILEFVKPEEPQKKTLSFFEQMQNIK